MFNIEMSLPNLSSKILATTLASFSELHPYFFPIPLSNLLCVDVYRLQNRFLAKFRQSPMPNPVTKHAVLNKEYLHYMFSGHLCTKSVKTKSRSNAFDFVRDNRYPYSCPTNQNTLIKRAISDL